MLLSGLNRTREVLNQFLDDSAHVRPDGVAIEEPGCGEISYRDLASLSDQLYLRLYQLGVRPGDRVGIYMRKSIDAVASIFGILKAGAAYVPVDPSAPASRNAYILNDCSVKVVITQKCFEKGFRAEALPDHKLPHLLVLEATGGGLFLKAALEREGDLALPETTTLPSPDDLAYVLYTSGSTGAPKGVALSHRNATSFIHWCSDVFAPRADDRFSSHAPFHFDLSILDIFLAIKHGATLILIEEETGKSPALLAPLIAEKRISIWYSTPSVLSLLAQHGKINERDYSSLRIILFAGEVFPVKHLRALKTLLPRPKYYNLYGPTETNVCTFYQIPDRIPEEQTQPFPIGKACEHLQTKVVGEDGRPVPIGTEGALCVSGSAVMQCDWNLPERTADAFFEDGSGKRWYKTGDIVWEDTDGNYTYVARKDRMVKKRGYRVELGEIDTCLYRHPAVKEAAVVARPDEEN
jgi:amino acid adenylation domain-containing protein